MADQEQPPVPAGERREDIWPAREMLTGEGMTTSNMLGTDGRKCETCQKGQKNGKAVSRYLGRWLCVQCARKAFGPKERQLPR